MGSRSILYVGGTWRNKYVGPGNKASHEITGATGMRRKN